MRWIAPAALLVIAGCTAPQPQPKVWQKANGEILTPGEMRVAGLACSSAMTNETWRAQTVTPFQPGAEIHASEALQDSPAYNRMSSASLSACLHSFGYSEVPSGLGYGSSTPPPETPAPPR